MRNTYAFTIPTNLNGLPAVIQDVNEIMTSRSIPYQAVYKISLALEEILTNVSKYGHCDGMDHEIKIRIDLRDHTVIMRCEDDGRDFNPLNLPRPDFTKPVQEREVGGLGLFLVKDMVDAMDYRRDHGKNILEIRVDH